MKISSYNKLKKEVSKKSRYNKIMGIILFVVLLLSISAVCYATLYGIQCKKDVIKSQEELNLLRKLQGNDYDTLHKQYPAMNRDIYNIIYKNGLKFSIHPKVMCSLIDNESSWKQYVVSVSGAMSYTQLMPRTAKGLKVTKPFDPDQNIRGGTEFFRHCYNKSGKDLRTAFMKYNAGPARNEYPEVSHIYANKCMMQINKTSYLALQNNRKDMRI